MDDKTKKYLTITILAIIALTGLIFYLYCGTTIPYSKVSTSIISLYFNTSDGINVSTPYEHVIPKYHLDFIDIYVSDPFKKSYSSIWLGSSNWTQTLSDYYTNSSDFFIFPPITYFNDSQVVQDDITRNITEFGNYKKSHKPYYFLSAPFMNESDGIIYSEYKPIYAFIMTSPFLTQTSYSTWECEYYFNDDDFYVLNTTTKRYWSTHPDSITYRIVLPTNYNIEPIDGMKIDKLGDMCVVTYSIPPGQTFHLIVKDVNKENQSKLFSELSLITLSILFGMLIEKFLKI